MQFSMINVIKLGKLELVFPDGVANLYVGRVRMKIPIRISSHKLHKRRIRTAVRSRRIIRIGSKQNAISIDVGQIKRTCMIDQIVGIHQTASRLDRLNCLHIACLCAIQRWVASRP